MNLESVFDLIGSNSENGRHCRLGLCVRLRFGRPSESSAPKGRTFGILRMDFHFRWRILMCCFKNYFIHLRLFGKHISIFSKSTVSRIW